MAQPLILDALYPEMEEATIGRWLIALGEEVTGGQTLAELITEKVVYEYQSPDTGVVLALLPAEKSVVPVGTVLAVLGVQGEDVPNLAEYLEKNRRLLSERETALTELHQATAQVATPVTPAAGGAIRATPAARRLARERGADLAAITGSGPGGMITVDDIPG